MTYFFHEGKIHVILNKLEKLESIDYDSNGTAGMVIRVLKDTLGLTHTKLARILRHFIYDGKLFSSFFTLLNNQVTQKIKLL